MPPGSEPQPATHASLRHPGRWLWLLLAIPIILGFLRLRFDAEIFDLLPGELPVVKGLKLYQEHFANARELMLTVEAPSAEQTEAAAAKIAAALGARPDLVESVVWQPPWLEHPAQAAELIAYFWLNVPPADFQELTNRLRPENLSSLLTEVKSDLTASMSPQEIGRLTYDPFGFTRLPDQFSAAAPSFGEGQEMFASADGTFRILFVKAKPELRSYKECEQYLREIRTEVVKALPAAERELKVGYTGRPVFVSEIASGMEHDMTTSVAGTAAIIAVLFWLAHRRIKPMLWLLLLLAIILASTLGLGGLIFGKINVVSIGFAAILLGLAVDYAVVHYQEALAQPHLSIPQIRHAIAPSIFWAAVTTISAFLVLNFGGLPGLGQLGTLVGLGVALAATIMIFEFLPPLFPGRRQAFMPTCEATSQTEGASVPGQARRARAGLRVRSVVVATVLLSAAVTLVLVFGFPQLDGSANALRPRHSPAYEALDRIQSQLNKNRDPLWVVLQGRTIEDVRGKLRNVEQVLSQESTNGVVADFTLPATLWPNPENQASNRPSALALAHERSTLVQCALTNGFASNAVAFAQGILDTFQAAASIEGTFWPTNPMSQWIFEKLTARSKTNYLALGIVNVRPEATKNVSPAVELAAALPQGVVLSGWPLLGSEILTRVQSSMWTVVSPMAALVLLSLFLAFRRAPEIVLSLAVLGLSGFCLLAVMRLAGWSWNLLNLMAVPLVLGTGVDYSIFMQLALRRHGGDSDMAWRSVGRALLLCGGTAVAGFGSLGLSSNAGMASLGRVCAVGIASNMLIAVMLLPGWWLLLVRAKVPNAEAITVPSSLYRAELWRAGLYAVRLLPGRVLHGFAIIAVTIYARLARERREIVVHNLEPALGGDRSRARQMTSRLFRNFAIKLGDLWRYEAGLPIEHLFGQTSGWQYFEQAQALKKGILLLTPHLGNWEFGGPMLTERGIQLQVITLAEPGEAFTQLRQASRAKWKIETLVIGNNPLAFVEIIRRLEQGATVALLIDRPPPPTALQVELFGQPFNASIAAAELARASGCVLLPVYVPAVNGKYEAHILPPIPYERQKLRDRAVRLELTQRIVNSFEPVIRRHLDQWYHFVPIWPKASSPRPPDQ